MGCYGLRSAPLATVTFLFTDTETSTCLWEEEEQAMRAALSRLAVGKRLDDPRGHNMVFEWGFASGEPIGEWSDALVVL